MRHSKTNSNYPNMKLNMDRIEDTFQALSDGRIEPTFEDICESAGIVPTDRQRRKFNRRQGAAYRIKRLAM